MARVIWHFTMSLDGFLADEHGSVSWMPSGPPAPMGTSLIPRIGAVLAGRGTQEAPQPTPEAARPYGGAYTGPVFVLTSREPGGDPGVVWLTDGLASAVDTARSAAGDLDVVLFGARLGQSCVAGGLVDEVLVHVTPVVLARGVRAFDDVPRSFEVIERSGPDELTSLRMRPL